MIIGEIEEGNIFDEIKMNQANNGEETFQITKGELQDLIDTIKLKHRAEMDAIMIEQTSYKKIIQQMIMKFKT